jgi:vacuolar-type H+-ATPase subunit E/Vma4
MIAFIRTHGDERVQTISKQAEDEFTIQKENYIAEQKEAIITDYKNKLQQDEIKLRIQKSAEQNIARIQKMKTVHSLVEKVYKEAQHKMVTKQNSDQGSYKKLV